MASYFGYFLLGAGVLTFVLAWFDKSRRSLPILFAAIMMVVGGLAILQFIGSAAPAF